MKRTTAANIEMLKRILEAEGPLHYKELLDRSGLTKGKFNYALKKAIPKEIRHNEDWELYFLPGQEPMAREKAIVGSIGNIQKLTLIKEAFHEIFMLRLMAEVDSNWKTARKIADRIEPLMEMVKEKDSDFPYSRLLHQAFQYHPEAITQSAEEANAVRQWQKYCADVLEYCARKLR